MDQVNNELRKEEEAKDVVVNEEDLVSEVHSTTTSLDVAMCEEETNEETQIELEKENNGPHIQTRDELDIKKEEKVEKVEQLTFTGPCSTMDLKKRTVNDLLPKLQPPQIDILRSSLPRTFPYSLSSSTLRTPSMPTRATVLPPDIHMTPMRDVVSSPLSFLMDQVDPEDPWSPDLDSDGFVTLDHEDMETVSDSTPVSLHGSTSLGVHDIHVVPISIS
ncbi:hypothetical protein HMI54_008935 [Coelomomyces lativittatus]|nr:hypothetical protein HMI56_004511 [Coelomomyces lativittatus]KAJ1502537.1 hypothetical protein HMI54_008935 [Coelomomyces lativittatus]